MAFASLHRRVPNAGKAFLSQETDREPDALPALVRQRDLALLAILVMIVVPEIRGMQFAQGAVFFYWVVTFVTFQLPSMVVFGWLARQAPARVPLYVWILRLIDERWRSVLLFLFWWSGVLIVLPAIGICLDLLRAFVPSWLGSVPAQCVAFVMLLTLATLVACLPIRLFRIVLWTCGLCYLAAFALGVVAALVVLIHFQYTGAALPPLALTALPAHFSWSIFGLAVLNQIGINAPLFLDGELRGPQQFLRRSTRYLWWAGLGALLLLLLMTIFWLVVNPSMQVMQQRIFPLIGPILGQDWMILGGWLLILGILGCALAFLLLFSRAFLMAARQHYLPSALARLNRAGTPTRAILTQSAVILGCAALLLVIVPALLQAFLPGTFLNELSTGDHFGLLAAIAGSLWCLLTALLFLFALWLFWKKHGMTQGKWSQRLVLPGMCLSGCVTALVCAFAPFLPTWPTLFFSHTHWFPLILVGFACSLTLAWVIGELPRRTALLRAKAQSLAREKGLHEQLQHSYTRECELHRRLQEAYDEQQILMLQQKVLLEEVNRLYREQEQLATTDQVTGLFNHRAFFEHLEAEVLRCHHRAYSFLLLFLDLDHFKVINDTWGHQAGDAVLHEVAQRLQNALRPGDVAGRYGGEEFTVILTNAIIEDARKEGERLRQVLRSAPCPGPRRDAQPITIPITASIGIAAYGLHGTRSEELLERADQAMYYAKLAGRDCVRIAGEQFPGVPSSILMGHPPQ